MFLICNCLCDEQIADDNSHESFNVHIQLSETLQLTQPTTLPPLDKEVPSKSISSNESNASYMNLENENKVQLLVDTERKSEEAAENSIAAAKKYNVVGDKYDKAVEACKKLSQDSKQKRVN